jgi:hypothetical protein
MIKLAIFYLVPIATLFVCLYKQTKLSVVVMLSVTIIFFLMYSILYPVRERGLKKNWLLPVIYLTIVAIGTFMIILADKLTVM